MNVRVYKKMRIDQFWQSEKLEQGNGKITFTPWCCFLVCNPLPSPTQLPHKNSATCSTANTLY